MANKGTCKYCGIASGNLSIHEPKCEKNPVNIQEVNKEPQQAKASPLIIKDVKEIDDPLMSAYFQVADGQVIERIAEFQGIMSLNGEDIPTVLITAQDGRILPPFMIQGFVGMYPPETPIEKPIQEEVEAIVEPDPEVRDEAVDAIRAFTQQPEPTPVDEAAPSNILTPDIQEPSKVKSGLVETLKNLTKKKEAT